MDHPLNQRWTLTTGQVAQMFGESEPTFRKRLKQRLEAGFPQRIPASTKWSKPLVEAWFRGNGTPAIEPVRLSAIDEARRGLEAQYSSDTQKVA